MNPYRLVPDPCKNFILLHHRRNISRGKRVRATSLVSSLLRTVRSSRGREKVRVERQHCVLWALVVVVDIFRLFMFLACDIVGHLRLTPFYFSLHTTQTLTIPQFPTALLIAILCFNQSTRSRKIEALGGRVEDKKGLRKGRRRREPGLLRLRRIRIQSTVPVCASSDIYRLRVEHAFQSPDWQTYLPIPLRVHFPPGRSVT
jgi:hypothetical protein